MGIWTLVKRLMPTTPPWPSLAMATSTNEASTSKSIERRGLWLVSITRLLYGAVAARRTAPKRRRTSSTTDGTGKRSSTPRSSSSTARSWRRRANTLSIAVPETTPSWPDLETARARFQSEMAIPIPPWISQGSVARIEGVASRMSVTFCAAKTFVPGRCIVSLRPPRRAEPWRREVARPVEHPCAARPPSVPAHQPITVVRGSDFRPARKSSTSRRRRDDERGRRERRGRSRRGGPSAGAQPSDYVRYGPDGYLLTRLTRRALEVVLTPGPAWWGGVEGRRVTPRTDRVGRRRRWSWA